MAEREREGGGGKKGRKMATINTASTNLLLIAPLEAARNSLLSREANTVSNLLKLQLKVT